MTHRGFATITTVGLALFSAIGVAAAAQPEDGGKAAGAREQRLLSDARQLTFEGRRAGEGYFSADGDKLIFQSERHPGNPFFQIYLMDLTTGDVRRVSTGVGKTTCAWLHPSGGKALFASTHEDPNAKKKQKREIQKRKEGKGRRYSWDFDKHYDIYEKDLDTGELTNLTDTVGYDAEGSYSPDGEHILFASNRAGYQNQLAGEIAERFEKDPSVMMDLYIMDADGSDVKRLTTAKGYDGGPFFSADGSRICWRRFSAGGHAADIFTADPDGSDRRRLTDNEHMSWAPFFHPSGEYLIYATNRHGFRNFELYLVRADGQGQPVRVTTTDGFDGLPAFSPDGGRLCWTSKRGGLDHGQLFLAGWNHQAARKLLGLTGERQTSPTKTETGNETQQRSAVSFDAEATSPRITADDLRSHVETLVSERMAGRATGTEGAKLATRYVAEVYDKLGLQPGSPADGWFQPFEFTAGVSLGESNDLSVSAADDRRTSLTVNEDWRPLAFSETGPFDAKPVVFAGYGIKTPKNGEGEPYDSYAHLDVKGKWVLVLRFMPGGISNDRRRQLSRYASLRYKAMVARDRGAAGLIVAPGPHSEVKNELIPLRFDASLAGTSIPAVSIATDVAAGWLERADKDLATLQKKLDSGEQVMGFDLPDVNLSARIELNKQRATGRNVLARLRAGDKPSSRAVLIGAHVDHLGRGRSSGSLSGDAEGKIHPGADDNASGVAAMLEIAQWLQHRRQTGEPGFQRDVIFAAWSGEELGILGSSHYAETVVGQPHQRDTKHGPQQPPVIAYVNMDMIGRYREKLTVQGVGSSDAWPGLIERANVPVGLNLNTQSDAYLPTDSTPFYVRQVPVLNLFTGAHDDYHKPSDTAEKLNYAGLEKVARFAGLLTRSLAQREGSLPYVAQEKPTDESAASGLRAYLGTIPDYAAGDDVEGVKLSGVADGGPADKAGVRGGDVVIGLAGNTVENIYDYTYAIRGLKVGEPVTIRVRRDGEVKKLKITPASRQ